MADAVERAYQLIRGNIVAGRYESGQHLRSEELALAVGVSRTPVREALRRLHSEGLVDFRTNYGAYVTGWTLGDLDEVFGLRTVLESYAAELAATALTPAEIDQIGVLAETTHTLALEKGPGFRDRIAVANNALHAIIIGAAASRRLSAMISGVMEMPLVMRTLSYYSDDALLRSAGHHRELCAAFRARDPRWAASIMRCHLLAAHNVMRGAIARAEGPPNTAFDDSRH